METRYLQQTEVYLKRHTYTRYGRLCDIMRLRTVASLELQNQACRFP